MNAPRYAELALTTNFSFLHGASHPRDYVAQASSYGIEAVGVADRNTVAGVVRAHAAARDLRAQGASIRVLPGVRLVTEDGFEAIAYPMDRPAWGRLCRLLTDGNRRSRKGECRFAFAEMLAASEGQVFIAMPPRRRLGPLEAFLRRLEALAAAAPGRTWLGASDVRRGDERRRLGLLDAIGRRIRAPMAAVSDALYHHPARRPLQDVLACNRRAAMQARFLAVRGRVQRASGVVHLVAEGFRDLSGSLRDLREAGMRLPPETADFGVPPDRRVYRSRDFH